MPDQDAPFKVREQIVLEKFDGDPPAEGEEKEPIERISLDDGVIVQHVVEGEVIYDSIAGIDSRPEAEQGQPYSLPTVEQE